MVERHDEVFDAISIRKDPGVGSLHECGSQILPPNTWPSLTRVFLSAESVPIELDAMAAEVKMRECVLSGRGRRANEERVLHDPAKACNVRAATL
jgi:hypothetical protein